MLSESEASSVYTTGDTGNGIFEGSFITNFVTSLFIAGSMDELWSIMNSLQVLEQIRLQNVSLPGNVSAFTAFFDDLTNLEVFDMEDEFRSNIYLPEKEPESLNIVDAGYDSNLFLFTARNFIFNGLLFLLLLSISLVLWLS